MSKTRILKNGSVVDELNKSVMLVIKTKAPTKYKLIDQETGEEYNSEIAYERVIQGLKGVLDKLDKIDEAVDKLSGIENKVEFVEEKEHKSFKSKYAKDI